MVHKTETGVESLPQLLHKLTEPTEMCTITVDAAMIEDTGSQDVMWQLAVAVAVS